MLQHNRIGYQHDDVFEGSNEEKRIFTKVFFGDDDSSLTRRHLEMGITTFEAEGNLQTDSSSGSNIEIFSANSMIFSKDVWDRYPCDNVHPTVADSISGFAPTKDDLVEMDDRGVMSKRRRTLTERRESEFSRNNIPPGASFPTPQCAHQSDPFHLVESSNKGLTVGLYLLKCSVFDDGCADNGCGSKLPALMGSYTSDAVLNKSTGTLGEIPKLLVHSLQPNAQTESESHLHDGDGRDDNCSIKSDSEFVAPIKDYFSDPLYHLHSHVICVLREAGWQIKRHRIKNRSSTGSVYISPDGRLVDDFSRAWNMCGRNLLIDGHDSIQEEIFLNWNTVHEFFFDLSNTMIAIENNNSPSPVHRWSLLNPFAFVVFVKKSFSSFKKGETVNDRLHVRANPPHLPFGSAIVQTDSETKCVLADKGEKRSWNSLMEASVDAKDQASDISQGNAAHIVQGIMNTAMQHPKKYLSSSVTRDSDSGTTTLPGSMSDISSIQSLYDVPVMMCSISLVLDFSSSATNREPVEGSSDFDGRARGYGNMLFVNDGSIPLPISEGNSAGSSDKLGLLFCDRSGGRYKKILCKSKKKKGNLKVFHGGDGSEKLVFTVHDLKRSKEEIRGRNVKDVSSFIEPKVCIEPDKSLISPPQDGKNTKEIEDDDLLISALVKRRDFASRKRFLQSESKIVKSRGRRKVKNEKGSYKLLPRSTKCGKTFSDVKWFLVGSRSMLSWLVNSGVISLNDVIQYRNPLDDSVIKCGSVVEQGILCKCCNNVFSLASFKRHAGSKVNEHCLNIFLESGRPLPVCQLEAWSVEYRARKVDSHMADIGDQSDDTCGFCGDGGELICCDNCPSTFHQACLSVKVLPEGSWYCLNCVCKICKVVVSDEEISNSNAVQCLQCEQKCHNTCLKGLQENGGLLMDSKFCCITCQEVYYSFRSLIGVVNYISSDLTWTLLKCIHGDDKIQSAQHLALKAECNSKLAVALTIMDECFLPMVDSKTAVDILPQLFYNMWSIFPRVNFRGFYTLVLEKDDEVVCVAVVRVHGKIAAEMPLIATCSKHRGEGMCRRLISIIEEMLKSLKVEMLVISAVPVLVDTWVTHFGFKPLEEDERRNLSTINLMVFPDSVRLRKQMVLSDTGNGLCGNGVYGAPDPDPVRPICGSDEPINGTPGCSESTMAMEAVHRPSLPNNCTVKSKLEGTSPSTTLQLMAHDQNQTDILELPDS